MGRLITVAVLAFVLGAVTMFGGLLAYGAYSQLRREVTQIELYLKALEELP